MVVSAHKELKFKSEEHDKLLKHVLDLYDMSANAQAKLHPKWKRAEDLYLAYRPVKEDDRERSKTRDEGSPEFTTVVLPFSYALLLTAHTYWTSVFLARTPVLQYTARHGEPQHKVQAVEAVMDYQIMVGKMIPPMYQWLLDAGKYGYGVVCAYWSEEYSQVSQIVEDDGMMGMISSGKKRKIRRVTRSLAYQGNRLFNIRPHDFFPDPRVSLANFQDGEFCARFVEIGWNALKASSEGYYNLDEIKGRSITDRRRRVQTSTQIDLPDTSEIPSRRYTKGMYDLVEMVVELIPSEWNLGTSEYPEKWLITVALEDVIIGCRPLGYNHNRYPFSIMMYETENYIVNPRGMMEVIEPLANVMDWLFNSHFYNVRKILNDHLLVDPMRVEMADLLRKGAGKIIRLRPQAYGSDLSKVVMPLPVQNVTQMNFKNMQVLFEMLFRVTGVNDNLMGLVNAGGRKTATEVRSSSSFGINRLKTFCEFNSALGMAPLSQQLLQNTQQLMDVTQKYRLAGDLMQGDPTFLEVAPEDIEGFYDFVPVDGTMPVDRFAQANLWKEILMGMAQMPQLAATYDMAGIFSWMAQLAGLKNITQFKIQVSPDQTLANAARAGNVRPINEGSSGVGGNSPPPTTNASGLAGPLGL